MVKNNAKIVAKATEPQPNEKIPMQPTPSKRVIDLTQRSLEEQLAQVKAPYYAQQGNLNREFEKFADNMAQMLVSRENQILAQNAEIAELKKELEKYKPKKQAK